LIVAVDHPFAVDIEYIQETGGESAYFETRRREEEWTFGGYRAQMIFWTRPLHAMIGAFTAAGFRINVISEPPIAPDTPPELVPDFLAGKAEKAFLCFVLEASCGV
jgi:hypothetical protein